MEADARAAIAIDPQDAEAHVVPGEALYNEGQFAESAAQYDTALRLNPGSADIAALAGGIICFMGQAERAATLADLNPAYPDWYGYYLGPAYYLAGRDEETVRVLGRMPPEKRLEFGWLPLAAAQSMLGHDAEARAARDAVLAAAPSFPAEAGLSAEWRITGQPERERFIEGVRRAGLPVCAAPAAAAGLAPADRLPECEAERARRLAVES